MTYSKTIVCFANSRKTSGRCIAGKEWRNGTAGPWIRPISARPTHELSEEERAYQDATDPKLLDIVTITMEAAQPAPHQHENHLIDPGYYWSKSGSLPFSGISSWLDQPPSLWGTGESTQTGLNNRLAEGDETGVSLYLVQPDRLRLIVGPKSPGFSPKRGVRGEFNYRGTDYRLDITDPVIERRYLFQRDGEHFLAAPVICVSLGDPFQGYYYKLIAGVLHV